MMWIALSCSAAFFDALKDVVTKKRLVGVNPYVAALGYRMFALPFVACAAVIAGLPVVQPNYWFALVMSGGINVAAIVLYMKAVQSSDLSLSVPMIAFTPLFLLGTSPLINHEMPSAFGFVGVGLIVVGSYILNIGLAKHGVLEPFRALMRERGARLMLTVAFLWSVSANFDKIGVQASSPFVWVLSVNAVGTLCLLPLALWNLYSKTQADANQTDNNESHNQTAAGTMLLRALRANAGNLLLVSCIAAVMMLSWAAASRLALVAYAISIKRTSVVLAVIFGRMFFHERNIGARAVGAVIMLLGVAVISFWG